MIWVLQRRYSSQKGGKKPGFSLSEYLISRMLNDKVTGFLGLMYRRSRDWELRTFSQSSMNNKLGLISPTY